MAFYTIRYHAEYELMIHKPLKSPLFSGDSFRLYRVLKALIAVRFFYAAEHCCDAGDYVYNIGVKLRPAPLHNYL